jgi:hypothetical protein
MSSTSNDTAGPGRHAIAFAKRQRAARYGFVCWTEDGAGPPREQFAIAADMVRVMMRRHDRRQRERVCIEIGDHRRRIAGIDDRGR